MKTEQLALDLGNYGWGAMPRRGNNQTVGGHFRKDCGSSGVWQMSLVYEAADRAWQETAPRWERVPVAITGRSLLDAGRTATALRRKFGLADHEPIESMVEILQSLGCVLSPMPVVGVGKVSSFSCWFDDVPLTLLRTSGASRRRVRFDAAHELGHLMMHKGKDGSGQVEEEAFAFARALLLPAAGFNICLKPFSWERLRPIADAYSVSVLAALRRARELELVSAPVYRAAMADSTRRGWRTNDPFDVQEPEAFT